MPKFGLTVEKRPGAAIEGGSTRIHLLVDSELTQVNKSALVAVFSRGGGRIRPLTKTTRRQKDYTNCLLPY